MKWILLALGFFQFMGGIVAIGTGFWNLTISAEVATEPVVRNLIAIRGLLLIVIGLLLLKGTI